MAGVRRRAGREASPHRRPDDVHDPRQRALDDDRMEEQGLVRQVDPDEEPRPAVPPAEVAAPDLREKNNGTEPRDRPERIEPDGKRDGVPPDPLRDRRDRLP